MERGRKEVRWAGRQTERKKRERRGGGKRQRMRENLTHLEDRSKDPISIQ